MKGKCRPGRRRLRARGRPGHYEEELVVGLLRREERCDVQGKAEGEGSSNRGRSLSGNAAKPPCKREKRKEMGAPRAFMKLSHFPLKSKASRGVIHVRLLYFFIAILAPRKSLCKNGYIFVNLSFIDKCIGINEEITDASTRERRLRELGRQDGRQKEMIEISRAIDR